MQVLRTAFTESLDPAVSKIVNSIEQDRELVSADLKGSMAHCAMLAQQGLITQQQGKNIQSGLEQLAALAAEGTFELHEQFEDVHMNVEKQLQALIGEDALRLHTARSRNDQVALDFRIYVSSQVDSVITQLNALLKALIAKSHQYPDAVMPGYTHLQRAQPIFFSHALFAFCQMFERDIARFKDAKARASVSPLGAGAQAGSALAIDPAFTALQLGMPSIFKNSIDAVMDRDFAVDFVAAASMASVHLSQLCETLIIWNTSEFGFIKFGDNVTTSSSLMPQKKNPDPVEIVRGKTGCAVGELVNLLVTLKALPLGYNRDLQETKEPVIRVSNSIIDCLDALVVCVEAIEVQSQKMQQAASDPDLIATDLVEYLVLKGVPFRTAHESVAHLVQLARTNGFTLSTIPLQQFQQCSDKFSDDVYELFDPTKSALSKTSPGGTGFSR